MNFVVKIVTHSGLLPDLQYEVMAKTPSHAWEACKPKIDQSYWKVDFTFYVRAS